MSTAPVLLTTIAALATGAVMSFATPSAPAQDLVELPAPVVPTGIEDGIAMAATQRKAGGHVTIVAEGAAPGEEVWLLVGRVAGLDSCSGAFGGQCEGINNFVVAERGAATAQGQVEFSWRPPHGAVGELYVQVGVIRGLGGEESLMSGVISTRLR